MSVTGSQLFTNLRLKANTPNSGNLTTFKANQFFQEALINLITIKYESLQGTKNFDELKYYIKTDQLFTPTQTTNPDGSYSNQIYLNVLAPSPNIPDYFHLLICKVTYIKQLPFTIINASNVPLQPITITLKEQNNIRSTDYNVTYPETYTISGITGNTNANGTFYVQKINPKQFQLYSDPYCLVPVYGNGVFGINSKPVLSKIYDRVASEYLPVEKYSLMAQPSFEYPKYQIAKNSLVFFPDFVPVQVATIDYISNSFTFVDCADSSTDLTAFYTSKWLLLLTDMAAELYTASVRDLTGVSIAKQQATTNP